VPFELLETIRWTPREGWYLLDRHLARLEASARHFQFPCSTPQIAEALAAAVRPANGALRVRLLLGEAGTIRIEQKPLDERAGIWRVRLAAHPIDPTDEFLYHKTTNRLVYERAHRDDCDDVVLWNPAGEATETTIANLVVDFDGRRVTPPVACGLLPGTFRAELLSTGQVSEAVVTTEQLKAGRRLWLVNSVRGWCDATLID
jgi:branched-subunit amino acid aminotransferase/4-amino-4-deoxychorismate lyase